MGNQKVKTLILATLAASSVLMSGCANGIGDTIAIAKRAEQAKETVSRTNNLNDPNTSIGTLATQSKPSEKDVFQINDFRVSFDGTNFTAAWNIIATQQEDLVIQIFADTDNDGYDGVKIANLKGQTSINEEVFSFGNLKDGDYFYYIGVGTSSETVSTFKYTDTVSKVVRDVDTDMPDGGLENVQVRYQDGSIYLTWDAYELESTDDPETPAVEVKYVAFICNADTGETIKSVTTDGLSAVIAIPQELDAFMCGAATYIDGEIGPFVAKTFKAK